jgi:hypothetical protein
LLALPFWAILLLVYPLRTLYALGIRASLLEWLLGAPHFFATRLLADLPRDVSISAAVLVAAIAAAGALIASDRFPVWHRPAFYLCLAGRFQMHFVADP